MKKTKNVLCIDIIKTLAVEDLWCSFLCRKSLSEAYSKLCDRLNFTQLNINSLRNKFKSLQHITRQLISRKSPRLNF